MPSIRSLASLIVLATLIVGGAVVWGQQGHEMVGRVAAESLPPEMPAFFRNAASQLSYLNPEPDRWKERAERDLDPAMNAKYGPEHYVNFEGIPESFFLAPNRYAYFDSLYSAGMAIPGPGLLSFTILELTQRLRSGFRLWRAAEDDDTRAFIEARILNDAGLLGHYVADGSNPHHTSVHHNGWASGHENPHGFTTDRRFHWRFESLFVRNNVRVDDVRARAIGEPRVFPDVRTAVLSFLRESNGYIEPLYRLEQEESFDALTASDAHHDFASYQLARGADMLRDLWWTAWVTSESMSPGDE
jgi:hypothetical protein